MVTRRDVLIGLAVLPAGGIVADAVIDADDLVFPPAGPIDLKGAIWDGTVYYVGDDGVLRSYVSDERWFPVMPRRGEEG